MDKRWNSTRWDWHGNIGPESTTGKESSLFDADSVIPRRSRHCSKDLNADGDITSDPRPWSRCSGHVDMQNRPTINRIKTCENSMLDSKRRSEVFDGLPHCGDGGVHGIDDGNIAIRTGEREIYRSTYLTMGPQQTALHTFVIPSEGSFFAAELKVRIFC